MEVINQQKGKITRLEDEYRKERARRQEVVQGLGTADKDKLEKMQKYTMMENENK